MVTTAYIAEATDVQLVCVTYELFLDCIKEAMKCQEEARKKKWASVALIIGAIGFIIIMIYFTVISSLNM